MAVHFNALCAGVRGLTIKLGRPNLTKIIYENFHIERWVLKIDNETNGRGIGNFFGFINADSLF